MKHIFTFTAHRYFLIALLCVTAVSWNAGTCLAESPVNLVPNGNFAEGELGQLPEGWTVTASNPVLAPTFQLVEENGKRLLMAQGNGRGNCFGFAKVPVTLERNKTYRLTVRFKIEDIEDVNRNIQHALIVPGWNNFNNGIFDYRREGDMIIGEHIFPVGEQSTYLGRIEPCEMRLLFRFSPHGKVWWEEVRLEECAPIAPRLVKIAVSVGKRGSSLDGWKAFLDDAGQRNCDIALLTEYFVPDIQEMEGPAMKMMAEKAKEWKMYVSCSIKLQRGDILYNSAPLFDREGNLVGIYDKVNLYDPELDQGISPGENVPVFDTDFGKLGIMICYDSWHPAIAKLLALKGAEVILCPNVGYYMQIMHARAADNGVVVAVTSSDGPAGVWDAGGHRADGGSTDSSRRGPTQIVAFEESGDKTAQFVTVDLSIEASPHYWGGPMLSAPGGRRVRATGNFYAEDEIQQEVRRWETQPEVKP